tara:strand:- start:638 stop:1039 length:402 start_codon:yes stop_codon:yes gene_type:complete
MINSKPDKKCLRIFAVSTSSFIGLSFGLLLPYVFKYDFPFWPWVICFFLSLTAAAVPVFLGPFYQIWMKLVFILGRFNATIIMGVIFYFVVTPIGLLMRLAGRNPIKRKFNDSLTSYRIPSAPVKSDDFHYPF